MNECVFYDMNVNTGFIEDNRILFLVKFGHKGHLEQLVNGNIRFSPSQRYVEQELLLHDKGQGDLLEGKMKIRAESAKMYHQETDKLMFEINGPTEILINIQDVNSMPICCFFIGTDKDCSRYADKTNYTIKFADEIVKTIQHDFHQPDSALIILEPLKFIEDMKNELKTIASSIRYYDYSIQTMQQYRFLCSGNEDGAVGAMTYENRYRHLLCKDISFMFQKEYRFIKLDELIAVPKQYKFKFNYDYKVVSCDELFSGLTIERKW